jgi:hypothetical protein
VTTLYTVAAVGELLSFYAVQFPIGDYAGEAAELAAMTREEVVAMLKRGSTGFSRGRSKYRGVTSEQAAVAAGHGAVCTARAASCMQQSRRLQGGLLQQHTAGHVGKCLRVTLSPSMGK